jgi:hypothetical protein
MLKRSIRPRTRLLIRGCVTPNSLAASPWVRLRSSMSLRTAIINVERIRRCSASSSSKPRSRNTFPLDGVIFVSMVIPTSEAADSFSGDLSGLPDTAPAQDRCLVGPSAAFSFQRRARRILLLQTSRRRRLDAPRRCGFVTRKHRVLRWPWTSSHPARVLPGPDATRDRPCVSPPRGKLSDRAERSLPRRAVSWPEALYKILYAGQQAVINVRSHHP